MRRRSPRSHAQAALAVVLIAVAAAIVPISPAHASGDPGACTPGGDALAAIRPLDTPADLPAIRFFEAGGGERSLADYRGRGVVLNFWATWCAPCVREMPELDALKADLAPDGIDVIAVSTDRGGHNAIQAFYDRTGVDNLESLHDPKGAASRSLGVRGLPTTLIIDRDGREVARIEGIHKYDTRATRDYLRRCIGVS